MENINYARVVKFIVGLKQGHEHGVFAPFLGAVLVELLEEVFVFLLGGGFVTFVLHFEHDRDDLGSRIIHVTEDVVTLAASPSVVVLLEISLRKRRGPEAVELDLAVLLKGFANHLCRQPRLHVPQAHDLTIAILELRFVFVFERSFGELLFERRPIKSILQLVPLFLNHTDCLGNSELFRDLTCVDLGLQALDLCILRSCSLLQFVQKFGLGQLGRSFFLLLRLLQCCCQRVAVSFHDTQSFADCQLQLNLTSFELGLQLLYFGILGRSSFLQLTRDLDLSKLNGITLILLSQFKTFVQLLFEVTITNLLQDIRIPCLIDLEGLAAVRADDFMHAYFPSALARISRSISGTAPAALSVAMRYAS